MEVIFTQEFRDEFRRDLLGEPRFRLSPEEFVKAALRERIKAKPARKDRSKIKAARKQRPWK